MSAFDKILDESFLRTEVARRDSQQHSDAKTNEAQGELAMKAIEANAKGRGIDDEECKDLRKGTFPTVYVTHEQCDVLKSVLGGGRNAIVTEAEKAQMRSAGFHPYFIATLAGPDGKNSFRIRRNKVAELASHFAHKEAIVELGLMGPDAKDDRGQVVKLLRNLMVQRGKDVKIVCIVSLGKIVADDKLTIKALKVAKRDKDPDVAAAAKEALAQIKRGEVQPPAPEPQPEPAPVPEPQPEPAPAPEAPENPEMNFTEADTIDPLGDHTMPELLVALRHSDPEVVTRAKAELNGTPFQKLFRNLRRALSHEDPIVRAEAARAFGSMGKHARNLAPKLATMLRDDDVEVKKAALQALLALGDNAKKAVPVLKKQLRKGDVNLRRSAVFILEKMGTAASSAASALAYAMADENSMVKQRSLTALLAMGTAAKPAVPALAKMLRSEDTNARAAAAFVLGKLGRKARGAIPALKRALDDPDERVRRMAARAIESIKPSALHAEKPAPAPEPAPAEPTQPAEPTEPAPEKKLSAKKAARMLADTDPDVQKQALIALLAMGQDAKPAVPILKKHLKSKDEGLRRVAVFVLEKMGPAAAKAAAALAQALGDKNSMVKQKALTALLGMGDAAKSAIPALIKVLRRKKNDAGARAGAAFVLGRLGPAAKSAIPALKKALNDPDQRVQQVALRAIESIKPSALPKEEPAPAPEQPAEPTPKVVSTPKGNAMTTPDILALVNQARAQGRQCGNKGHFKATAPLTWNDELAQAAIDHSIDMATNRHYSHAGTDGSDSFTRAQAAGYGKYVGVSENIALGHDSIELAMEGWLKSPGHCKNIMNPDRQHLGVAKASGLPPKNKNGSYGEKPLYWTMMLGKR